MSDVRERTLPTWLDLLLRFVVGGTFVYASLDKIADPAGFAQAIFRYRMVDAVWLHPMALTLPWLELVTGLALILGRARRGAALLILLMLAVFMAAIVSTLARNLDITCGCFHTEGGHAVGMSLLVRDALLAVGSIMLLMGRRAQRGSRAAN